MAGGVLAWHHPLWPVPLSVLLVIWCGLVARFPSIWLFVVPACLPFLNFSPWSGWIVFEEFDLLLLGVAVGGYGRRAWGQPGRGASIRPVAPALSRASLVLIVAVLLLSLIALWRGVDDAGGLTWDCVVATYSGPGTPGSLSAILCGFHGGRTVGGFGQQCSGRPKSRIFVLSDNPCCDLRRSADPVTQVLTESAWSAKAVIPSAMESHNLFQTDGSVQIRGFL